MSVQPETVEEMVIRQYLLNFTWVSLKAMLAGAHPAAVGVGAVGVGAAVVPALGALVLVPTA